MTVLHLVPSAYLRQTRRRLSREGQPAMAATINGLAAQILRSHLISYTENRLLEEVAVWQSVQDLREGLQFFAPIAEFSGFTQELRWLFSCLDYGEDIYARMPQPGREELEGLYNRYHEILSENGVLSVPGQIKRVLDIVRQEQVLPEVQVIRLVGLGELRPLENQFVQALARGRRLEEVQPRVQDPVVEVIKAPDPAAEVELIAEALRRDLEQGASVETLAVAFPNPGQYLPLIIPVFERLKISWQAPGTTLRNTPLGKVVLTLIAGGLAGWDKRSLELLTAPGWGFPFGLSSEEHRMLRLAPPLKGLPAWRSWLGQAAGWQRVLALIEPLRAELTDRPLAEYGFWLESLLEELDPEGWVSPQDNLEHWAELVKAWDAMQGAAQTLQCFQWVIGPAKFLKLLEGLLTSFVIRPRRVFAERVQVLSTDQLGAHIYDRLYAGGIVEGQFPPQGRAHWLTRMRAEAQRDELYARVVSSAHHVCLYYPEVDREGKLNLPATVLGVKKDNEKQPAAPAPIHQPSLFIQGGTLNDPELLAKLREKVLKKGLSVSQLNTYASCPFRFFCSYVLELEVLEEESLELGAGEHGTIVHEVLRTFWERHLTGTLPTVEESQILIEELLAEAYLERGCQPPADLTRALRSFIRQDVQRAEGGFRPAHLEREFDNVAVSSKAGSVLLKGRIDRIDWHPDGVYVLYDYKTGRAPTRSALLDGGDLQIASYLLAAQTLLPEGRSVGAAYYLVRSGARAGVFHESYSPHLKVQRRTGVLAEEEFAEQQDKFAQILSDKVNSILEGSFPVEPASSDTCSFCPFQGICRKEVGTRGF